MSALSIQPVYPIFTDIDGQPLEDGFVWIGQANLDPQVNPINVYWDAALTIPAGQPIRTLGGYPSNSGTPARLYVNSDYSIRVMNKNGSTVYSASAATERLSNVVTTITLYLFDTVADMTAFDWSSVNISNGLTATTRGFYSVGDGGGGDYLITSTGVADGFSVLSLTGLRFATLQPNNGEYRLRQLGAVSDANYANPANDLLYKDAGFTQASTDNQAVVQWAFSNVPSLLVIDGKFWCNGTINLDRDKITIRGLNKWDSQLWCDGIDVTDQFCNNVFWSDLSVFGLTKYGIDLTAVAGRYNAYYTGRMDRMHVYGATGAIKCNQYSATPGDVYETTLSDITVAYAAGGGVINPRSTRLVLQSVTNYPSSDKYYQSAVTAPIILNPSCVMRDCNMGYGGVNKYVEFANPSSLAAYLYSTAIFDNCNLESANEYAVFADTNSRVSLIFDGTEVVHYNGSQPPPLGAIRVPRLMQFVWSDRSALNYTVPLANPAAQLISFGREGDTDIDVRCGATRFTNTLTMYSLNTQNAEVYSAIVDQPAATISASGSVAITQIAKQALTNFTVPDTGVAIAEWSGNSSQFTASLNVSVLFAVGTLSGTVAVAGQLNASSTGFQTTPSVVFSGAQALDFSSRNVTFNVALESGKAVLRMFVRDSGGVAINKTGVYARIHGQIQTLNFVAGSNDLAFLV
jgi:hypothetical protein